mgnify:CR=1 FL=1
MKQRLFSQTVTPRRLWIVLALGALLNACATAPPPPSAAGGSGVALPNPRIWTPPVKRNRVVPARFVEWFPRARRRSERERRGRDSSRISGLCVERHADSGP